jgi:eukaryotic-like serine/threonine-protein kinase
MSIAVGTRLGPYEITSVLGAGGMGEVWRARDTRLARDVALKILPELFACDSDRLLRFQREAQVLASLNHPNIGAIYGLEDSGGVHALVLELVEGQTLGGRIAQGAVPLEEAVAIAKQITEALEAAHARGVIHRDLKPGNVKVRPDGTVKVLDFGLAKAFDPRPDASDMSLSPTMTSPAMTRMGVIMGTAAYMSPEQARGSVVDSRADIWAFGVVLYEMLAGKTLFEGATVSDTLAAVLRADIEWGRLPSNVPPALRTLLRRCLQRDPKQRLQHIGDARIELEDLQRDQGSSAPAAQAPRRWGQLALAALLSALVVGPLGWSFKPASPAGAPTSVIIRTPSEMPMGQMAPLALSPDGRQLVYVVGLGARRALVHQSLNVFEPRLLVENAGARVPFFSPRGDTVGFYSESTGEVQQVRLSGGTATRLLDAADSLGASWGEDGTIVFSAAWGQPLRIRRPGTSESTTLTRLNVEAGERGHLWPQILPGTRAVLFTIWTGAPTWDEVQLGVADLETGEHTVVLRGGASGRYASSGHLIFWRGNALAAAPFDLETQAVTGEPVRVVEDVRLDVGSGSAHFALSESGTLAYVKGGADTFAESFVADRTGKQVGRLDETESVGDPVFSPDGQRVALTLFKGGGAFGIGVYDLQRRLLTPLPLAGDNVLPTWTREGDRITFLSDAGGRYNYYSIPFDGGGRPQPLFSTYQGSVQSALSWLPNGRSFVYARSDDKTGRDLWLGTTGQPDPKPLLATAANESAPTFSPDGRFIAYQSDESGALEVYVRPFPQVEERRELISRSGGTSPRWSRDGTEIFYVSEKGLMRVPVAPTRDGSGTLSFGEPSLALAMTGLTSFDTSPDGRSFAIARSPIEKAAKEIRVVLNWFEELRRLVPGR